MKNDLAVQDILELLDLEKIEENIFRGKSSKNSLYRVFGGQVLGQALVAAGRTVDGRACHSLHAYFLRAGDPKVPILYEVDRSRDGSSFTSRRVVAIQHGRAIFTLEASFQREEAGYDHAFEMPKAPDPGTLENEEALRAKIADRLPEDARLSSLRIHPIEIRPVNPRPPFAPEARPPQEMRWIRAAGTLPDDPKFHQCLLAYASDLTLLETAMLPHGIGWHDNKVQLASLDHAMWFHRSFRVDEWLLYVQDSPSASGARSFNRGMVFTRDGKLAASMVQEALMRPRRP